MVEYYQTKIIIYNRINYNYYEWKILWTGKCLAKLTSN
jgi:hypothetical protein